jgi:HAD superfamily hydrolase (TIGR01509 family)
MTIRALVFDLFDTLVDLHTETIPRAEIAGRTVPRTLLDMHARVREHLDVEPLDFLERMRDVDRELRETRYAQGLEVPTDLRFGLLMERLGLAEPELTRALVEMHMGGLRAQVRAVAHHAGLLASLRRQARVGLCSNFSHSPTALRVLAESGLDAHLDAVVISDEVGIRKPRPEIFRAVLEALDVAPEETLHVGDSLDADVRGAAAVGIRTVWITRRVRDPEAVLARFEGPAPDWQIADLAELPKIVAGAAPAA